MKTKVTTLEAAEIMLKSGQFYTASSLGKALGLPAYKASGLLYNIRHADKYQTIETAKPNRQVKVIDIEGRTKIANLWAMALGTNQHLNRSERHV